MAYPYDGMFYPTLPEDTQDFGQVLSGVGRSLREIGRSTQYLPYDVLGAPVDLATLAMRPMGYTTERPVGGSDWLIELARQYGLADRPTGSGIETATRLATGITSPTAVPRAVGKFAQGLERASDITTEQANRAADALVRQITGNPTATAPQVLQETSMPFMQAVAPKAPSLLEAPAKSDLGFYSALEQATIPLQNKGTGSQFLAQIEKTAGVKPDEIKWTGLDEFLKSKPNVTKAEVQDYLAANRVNLQEVQLGGPEAFDANRLSQLEDEFAMLKQHPIDDPNFGEAKYDEMIRLMNIRDQSTTSDLYRQADNAMMYAQRAQARGAQRAAENLFRQYELLNARAEKLDLQDMGIANPTKFSQYTLPGGKNYRELLLTLPSGPRQTKFEVFDPSTQRAVPFETREEAVAFANQDPTRSSVVAEVDVSKPEYRSSHFDQPNILAHMRVNDRVVDGKKTLFIEEIQSDWHQAGRKKGYADPNKKSYEVRLSMNGSRVNADGQAVFATREEAQALADRAAGAPSFVAAEVVEMKPTGVPDAPFKTTWHELTLKRAIQEASEKGYDQIAFTTGKTQVERYPEALRQVADEIVWDTYGGGTRHVMVKKNGATIFGAEVNKNGIIERANQDELIGKNLEEVIGKPMTQRAITEEAGEIKGKDFTVGGKGMEGFYDQILPKTLEKMGKKFDAKVGKTDMDGVEVWQMDITPKMRESVLTKGQPLFAATPALPALGLLGGEEE